MSSSPLRNRPIKQMLLMIYEALDLAEWEQAVLYREFHMTLMKSKVYLWLRIEVPILSCNCADCVLEFLFS